MRTAMWICTAVGLALCGCGSRLGEACGTPGALPCGAGEYCRFEDGTCGHDGQPGVCETLTELCLQIFAPVCGCDGITYGNDCMAARAGVSLDHQGECME